MDFSNYFELKQQMADAIVQMVSDNPNLSYKEIGKRLGVHGSVVRYYASKAGIERIRGKRPTQEVPRCTNCRQQYVFQGYNPNATWTCACTEQTGIPQQK